MIDALLWSGRALAMLALHGSALIAVVWLLDRIGALRTLAIREWFWRCAVFAGLISASLQLAVVEPLTGHWAVVTKAVATALPTTSEPVTANESSADSLTHAAAPSVATAVTPWPSAPALENTPARSALAPSALVNTPLDRVIAQWPLLVLALWLAAAAMRFVALSRSSVQLRALCQQATSLHRHALLGDAGVVADAMSIAVPRLAGINGVDSPMALPGRLVVLPVWALALPSSQRRALLAHEFAHVQRRDPEWRVAYAGWRALACGIPLLDVALRRLDHLAELQCDDASARVTGEPHALAECLVRVLTNTSIATTSFPPSPPRWRRRIPLFCNVPSACSKEFPCPCPRCPGNCVPPRCWRSPPPCC